MGLITIKSDKISCFQQSWILPYPERHVQFWSQLVLGLTIPRRYLSSLLFFVTWLITDFAHNFIFDLHVINFWTVPFRILVYIAMLIGPCHKFLLLYFFIFFDILTWDNDLWFNVSLSWLIFFRIYYWKLNQVF